MCGEDEAATFQLDRIRRAKPGENVVHSTEGKAGSLGAKCAPASDWHCEMKTLKFTYWRDGEYYLGFWNDYPDYQTQGMSKDELVGNLKSMLADFESGEVPAVPFQPSNLLTF